MPVEQPLPKPCLLEGDTRRVGNRRDRKTTRKKKEMKGRPVLCDPHTDLETLAARANMVA